MDPEPKMSEHVNKRRYYRLRYPEKEEMPRIELGEREYPISEISEGGMRVLCPADEFKLGESIEGIIKFVNEDTVPFNGLVYRRDEHEHIFAPLEGVNMQRIVTEQRRLMYLYASVIDEIIE